MLRTLRPRARHVALTVPAVFGLAAALSAGLTVQACTITTTDGTDSGTYNACNSCQATTCQTQWNTCQNDANCYAIYTCATAANCDEQCVTDCYNARGTGTADPSTAQVFYTELYTCQSDAVCGNCASTCGTNPATCTPIVVDSGSTAPFDSGSTAPIDSGIPTSCHTSAAETCTQCQSDCCSPEVAQCTTGTPCATYVSCITACATSDCLTACATNNPQGKTESDSLGSCTAAQSCTPPNCIQQ